MSDFDIFLSHNSADKGFGGGHGRDPSGRRPEAVAGQMVSDCRSALATGTCNDPAELSDFWHIYRSKRSWRLGTRRITRRSGSCGEGPEFQVNSDPASRSSRSFRLRQAASLFNPEDQWYNRRHGRYGVLWADRFKSVLLEGGEAVAAVAAYIELNPVRAGLCADPKDYRYCGYAEALANGSSLARQGISIVLGQPETASWKEVSRQYRKLLFVRGSLHTQTTQPLFDQATAQSVVDQQNGELSLPTRLRCRIRYFTDGVILGSQAFVESHFYRLKEKLGYRRRHPATRLRLLGDSDTLWVFRDLRVLPTG